MTVLGQKGTHQTNRISVAERHDRLQRDLNREDRCGLAGLLWPSCETSFEVWTPRLTDLFPDFVCRICHFCGYL